MLQIEIINSDGKQRLLQVHDDCVIGKSGKNEVRLDSWRVGKEHARLFKTPSGVLIEDMGAYGGVYVNGQRIDIQHGPLAEKDVIGIGSFKLRVTDLGKAASAPAGADPIKDGSTAGPHRRYRVVLQDLSLNVSPDTNALVLQHLNRGQVVQALPQAPRGNWMAVQADQRRGWVAAQWLAPE